MTNAKQIEVRDIFKHENKDYVLFKIKNNHNEYLYISSTVSEIRSLLFGKKMENVIKVNLNDPKITCIECHLGNRIEGGVSLDEGEIVESNLSIEQANKILKTLKACLKEKPGVIKLF